MSYLLSTKEKVVRNIDSAQLKNSFTEKLLSVIIDSKLTFEEHVKILCRKVRSNFSALSRVVPFMKLN